MNSLENAGNTIGTIKRNERFFYCGYPEPAWGVFSANHHPAIASHYQTQWQRLFLNAR